MITQMIAVDAVAYPANLLHATSIRSSGLTLIGNRDILANKTLALLSSVRCPGDIILGAYDLAVALREAGVTVVGGFHSPMEQECLRLLLRGAQPVVVCPARSVERMRLPVEWKQPIEQGRLLLVSPFAERVRRPTRETAQQRNRFVAALADAVFVAHATPGGKTEAICREILSWPKPLYTLDSLHNSALIALGARPVSPQSIRDWWLPAESSRP